MTPLEFLTALWPANGFYCLAVPYRPAGAASTSYAHQVFPTITAAAKEAERRKLSADIFFCIHSLREEKVWNPKKVDPKTGELGAYEKRTQRNMLEARAFFFDLDVGAEEKKYASQSEALADLIRFVKEARLPKPLVTSSGGGLHVYWRIETALSSDLWRQHAQKLRQLATHHHLRVDMARTTDTASVLRVAGTYNRKRLNDPRVVNVLADGVETATDDFVQALDDAVVRAGVMVTPVQTHQPIVDSGLGTNTIREFEGPAPSLRALVMACPQMLRIVQLRGNVSEPEWYHALGVVRFVENSERFVYKVSEGHPDYSPDATDRKLAQHEAKGHSATTCRKLAEVCGDELCARCTHLGKVKSPIVAARKHDLAPSPLVVQTLAADEDAFTVPEPPYPFKRLKSGLIIAEHVNADNETEQETVLTHDLYPLRRIAATDAEQQIWRVHLPRAEAKDFTLDADGLYDMRKFAHTISNQGIYPIGNQLTLVRDYMTAYIAQLQKLVDADRRNDHLGWIDDMTKFVLADKILLPNGTAKPTRLSSKAINSVTGLTRKGTLERQVDLIKFYNHDLYVQHQFMIMAGLAAPIFYMTGEHGAIINAYGESGASKSTALYTAASFWGHPKEFALSGLKESGTLISRIERAAILANLPFCLDEITEMEDAAARAFCFSVSQASPDRGRGAKDGGERAKVGSLKATLTLTTSNRSLYAMLSTNNAAGNASAMRVIEMTLKPIEGDRQIHETWDAVEYMLELRKNYGWIGEAFLTFVMQHQPAIEKHVLKTMQGIETQAKLKPSERFWSASMATSLVAGEIAFSLGLLPFNTARVRDYLITQLIPTMRGTVRDEFTEPLGILIDYIMHITGDTVSVSKPLGGNLANVTQKPRGPMLAHHDQEKATLWVLKKGFKDYCAKVGANATRILDDLYNDPATRVLKTKQMKFTLGAGTEYAKAQSWCFGVDLAHPLVKGKVGDVKVVATTQTPISGTKTAKANLQAVE